jgi:hypothetical protein
MISQKKWRTPSERARRDLFSGVNIGCLSIFLSEHNKKIGESYMGKKNLFEVLTNTEYVRPPIGPLNHAHHGADSAALLPGCM